MSSVSQFPFFALKNKSIIDLSIIVGCFHCMKIFDKSEIKNYTDNGQTIICPLCQVDSVVGNACGIEVSEQLLKQANDFWYKKQN